MYVIDVGLAIPMRNGYVMKKRFATIEVGAKIFMKCFPPYIIRIGRKQNINGVYRKINARK